MVEADAAGQEVEAVQGRGRGRGRGRPRLAGSGGGPMVHVRGGALRSLVGKLCGTARVVVDANSYRGWVRSF